MFWWRTCKHPQSSEPCTPCCIHQTSRPEEMSHHFHESALGLHWDIWLYLIPTHNDYQWRPEIYLIQTMILWYWYLSIETRYWYMCCVISGPPSSVRHVRQDEMDIRDLLRRFEAGVGQEDCRPKRLRGTGRFKDLKRLQHVTWRLGYGSLSWDSSINLSSINCQLKYFPWSGPIWTPTLCRKLHKLLWSLRVDQLLQMSRGWDVQPYSAAHGKIF